MVCLALFSRSPLANLLREVLPFPFGRLRVFSSRLRSLRLLRKLEAVDAERVRRFVDGPDYFSQQALEALARGIAPPRSRRAGPWHGQRQSEISRWHQIEFSSKERPAFFESCLLVVAPAEELFEGDGNGTAVDDEFQTAWLSCIVSAARPLLQANLVPVPLDRNEQRVQQAESTLSRWLTNLEDNLASAADR